MKRQTRLILAVLLLLPEVVLVQAQDRDFTLPRWGVKTNLLYDATATINLGVEVRTGQHTSIDLSGNYNNWEFKNDRKWKHYLVQPEFRYWLNETFDGHFFGAHALWALYNVGNLPKPPFSEYMKTHRFEGWLGGIGASYGYRYNFDHRWAVEGTIGLGYVYKHYDVFNCGKCGELLATESKNYFGPTKVGISLIFGFGGKSAEPAPVYLTPPPPPAVQTPPPYEPVLRAGYVIPDAEQVKVRSQSGSAYLEFVVDRSEIVPGFRNNASELQKIYSTVQLVHDNPDMTITSISIEGYASPEGSYDYNLALSERRSTALRNHVRSVSNGGLAAASITSRGEGEDWATLDSLVSASRLFDKNAVLSIIRSRIDPDLREARLKQLGDGSTYRQIFAEFYPQLRRSDYRVGYTVTPFTVEKGKDVLRTRPGDLSLNEMFLIASTYSEGSAEFNEVFETAANVFPASDVANLNAAANALNRRDAASAARYLGRVKQQGETYWNDMGLLAWLQGDKQRASECFARGGALGAANAAELLKHMQSLTDR